MEHLDVNKHLLVFLQMFTMTFSNDYGILCVHVLNLGLLRTYFPMFSICCHDTRRLYPQNVSANLQYVAHVRGQHLLVRTIKNLTVTQTEAFIGPRAVSIEQQTQASIDRAHDTVRTATTAEGFDFVTG